MRNLLWIGSAVFVVLALGIVGCSNSNTNSSTSSGPISSQPGNKVASNLTASEATQVCEEVNTSIANAMQSPECYLDGVVAGAMAAQLGGGDAKTVCQSAYSDCMKQPVAADAGTSSCSTAASDLSNCTATIQQLNQCSSDYINAYKSALASVNCDAITSILASDAGLPTSQAATPASCSSIMTICPGVQTLMLGG